MTINTQKLLADHGSIAPPPSPTRLERLKIRALQQLDYSGPGSRGKSIYVGATEVLELVAAARALTDAQNALDAQAAEIDRLRNMAWTNGDILKEAQAEVVKRRGQIIRLRSTLRRLGVGFEAGRDNASRMFEESGSPYHEGRKVAYDQAAADVRAALSGESKC